MRALPYVPDRRELIVRHSTCAPESTRSLKTLIKAENVACDVRSSPMFWDITRSKSPLSSI